MTAHITYLIIQTDHSGVIKRLPAIKNKQKATVQYATLAKQPNPNGCIELNCIICYLGGKTLCDLQQWQKQ